MIKILEKQEIKHYNSLADIREEFVREKLKKKGIPYEEYNPIMHGQIRGEHKNIKYTKKLILQNRDNETINKKLRRYRNIEIIEEGLDIYREFYREKQLEFLQTAIYYSFEDNNDITNSELRESLKESYKLIESGINNLTDKDINQRRENAMKRIRKNKIFSAINLNIIKYDNIIWNIIYILKRITNEGLDHCPHCLSLGEPNEKVNLERVKRYRKLNERRYNRAKKHLAKTIRYIDNERKRAD